MTLDIVSIPVNGRWHYAAPNLGPLPRLNPVRFTTEFIFGASTDQLDQRISLTAHLAFNHVEPHIRAAQVTLACAPHVIRQYLLDPLLLTMPQANEIDLDAWMRGVKNIGRDLSNLPEALEGSKAEYMRLCREDVLRILLHLYDEQGAKARLTTKEVLASPLKRRHYSCETVSTVLGTLREEGKVRGGRSRRSWTQEDLRRRNERRPAVKEFPEQWSIVAQKHDEIESFVGGIEEKALGVAGPSHRRFEIGERSKAWQELRRIVRAAAKHVWIEDNYVNSDVVSLLREDLPESAKLRVLGPVKENKWWDGALASLNRLGGDFPGRVEVRVSEDVHDRYIYVDGNAWRSSDSFKDMAAKRTTKITDEGDRSAELITDFKKRWSSAQQVYPP